MASDSIRRIQQALKDKGFDPGPVDGVWGRAGNPLGARQWETFGDATAPRLGAVMVFWRESLASGKGHVGFYVGEDDTAYQILGGNQSDKVCLMWLAKDRLRGARWPKTASFLTSGPLRKSRNEGLSTNEA